MKGIMICTLIIALTAVACGKWELREPEPTAMTVANAVKTGDWMVLFMESGITTEIGTIFVVFKADSTLSANRDGNAYSGSWKESKTSGSHTLRINIVTNDTTLQKVNKLWNVVRVKEYYIDLTDTSPASNISLQLMKH